MDVQEVIRVPQKDYPVANGDCVVTHFGLPIHDSKVGSMSVLPKIIRHGYYIPEKEEGLPLLSFEDVWIARIRQVIESIAYEQLSADCFSSTIGNVRNTEELKFLILERYRETLPHLSDDHILCQGVSVRQLELIRKVSFLIEE